MKEPRQLSPMNEVYQLQPTGYLVRLVNLLGLPEKERCEALDYFFGREAQEDAYSHFKAYLDPVFWEESLGGKYKLTLYPAWKGNEEEPNEYDEQSPIASVVFFLEHKPSIDILYAEGTDCI